jgi:hypothetical protein
MKSNYSPEMQQQLKDSVELLKMILGHDLIGVYLYGSSLVGGLQNTVILICSLLSIVQQLQRKKLN